MGITKLGFFSSSHERLYGFAAVLFAVWLTVPVAVRFPKGGASSEPAIEELRALVANSSGRPSQQDLTRFESKFSHTRAAALAMFLRGYLHYAEKDYAGAIDALDAKAIATRTSIGAYALFYRAQSEEAA